MISGTCERAKKNTGSRNTEKKNRKCSKVEKPKCYCNTNNTNDPNNTNNTNDPNNTNNTNDPNNTNNTNFCKFNMGIIPTAIVNNSSIPYNLLYKGQTQTQTH